MHKEIISVCGVQFSRFVANFTDQSCNYKMLLYVVGFNHQLYLSVNEKIWFSLCFITEKVGSEIKFYSKKIFDGQGVTVIV